MRTVGVEILVFLLTEYIACTTACGYCLNLSYWWCCWWPHLSRPHLS